MGNTGSTCCAASPSSIGAPSKPLSPPVFSPVSESTMPTHQRDTTKLPMRHHLPATTIFWLCAPPDHPSRHDANRMPISKQATQHSPQLVTLLFTTTSLHCLPLQLLLTLLLSL